MFQIVEIKGGKEFIQNLIVKNVLHTWVLMIWRSMEITKILH